MTKTFKVGVVGAGNMGSGIAQKMAQEGLDVTLVDMTKEQVERGISTIYGTLQEGIERGIFTENQVSDTMARIHGTSSYEALKDADLVVEAVFEDLEIKGGVFAKLDKICDSKTIFATNTSTIFIREIAKYTSRPDKVVGMHYFYHPAKNRLVEVIPHDGTSKETIETTLLIGKLHNKTCIVVKDSPGFAVNRYFTTFLTEAIYLFDQGVANIPTIDAAAKQGFEIGMGPFELMNVTGVPIALHASTYVASQISEFYAPVELLKKQVEMKEDWDLNGEIDESKFAEINRHLYATIFGVAGAQVDEEVASIEDTDRGAKIGLRWKLGPFELMNKVGVQESWKMVQELYKKRPGFHLPEVLKKQAEKGEPFEFRYIDLEIKDSIAYITINRPEVLNALNPAVVDQLEKAFNKAENNPQVKGISIQGAGKAFVAGADIKYFIDCIKNNQIENNVAFTRKGHELLRRFETSDKVTVAVLDGISLGGGSEMALACQAIVATSQGSMGFPESGIGIYPGLGGMLRMNHHVGKELAKYYTFTGKTLSAHEAKELGIVTELVEMENIETTIKKLVQNGKSDKYVEREIPSSFSEYIDGFSEENVQRMLKGQYPEGVSSSFAEKTINILSKKGLIALQTMNELINKESEITIDESIELELESLVDIFETEDALTGLISTTTGKRPIFIEKVVVGSVDEHVS
ncbi:3-hydroxyacyl-CoA dehydrogenase NAD-binding domain-containing protein [Alkalihalobacillus sp. MEB130]|uniref:3-hydroxyacyl-CoA dehydrogenase/enoyl-CoA hydratase family protein n=1 Tax=Alkalihalobacillus sp. MEB130 TaxID=2976704 RepID=UPI0028DF2564|nr:3-hydroxyacyl-CoA dehydrogenase NAD-binding domain-containing protein [Alkalihalobacillus sp. MEB130]MDT8860264.1 3-hydroxyacyl-CoA dehydrogenase NAD-binding domain-containing protein [Alkalihalobacillus sp. MEB130]